MNQDILMVIAGFIVNICNCAVTIMIFPRKYSIRSTIIIFSLYSIAFYVLLFIFNAVVPDFGGLPGLAFLPIVIILYGGYTSQKVFQFLLQFILISFQVAFAETISKLFVGYGENISFAVYGIIFSSTLILYVSLAYKYRLQLYEKLYNYGSRKEWTLYAFGAVFSFALITSAQIAPDSTWFSILMLFFILWSFVVLCFAMINTHEKTKHKYEAEFARDIISSGQEHYKKMNEMYESLRILRHDYKYHLNTVSELLNLDKKKDAEVYLAEVQKQLSINELPNFCSNSVINALIISYYERFLKLNIKFDTQIIIPKDTSIPNYDMCIVLGNLLENALEACKNHKDSTIELIINTQGSHLAIKVKNSFNGKILDIDGHPVSNKDEGGLGLRSVQAVALHHGGELMTEWNSSFFTAYVLIKM